MSSITRDYCDYNTRNYNYREGFMATKLREIAEAMKIAMIKTWADLRVMVLRGEMKCLVIIVNLEMM